MKRWLIGLLALLVLTGCSQQPESTTADTTPAPTAPPTGLYEPESTLEIRTAGAVKAFPLGTDGCVGVRIMGDKLLILCLDTNGALELDVLTGDTGIVEASVLLEGVRADSVSVSDDRIACYNVTENCILILDAALHITDRISMPDGIEGDVLIDSAISSAYYCTSGQIRAMDLTTEVPRLLHQHEYQQQSLYSVILEDKVLVCQVEDSEGEYFEFIDTTTGQTLAKDDTTWQIDSWTDRYFLRRTDGSVQENLFGTAGDQVKQLNITAQTLIGLPAVQGAVTISDAGSGVDLQFFDLQTGLILTQTTLSDIHAVYSLCSDPADRSVWFIYEDSDLCQDILCRWDTARYGCADETVYTSRRYTAEAPDTEGLALCAQRAQALNDAYGIQIVFDSSLKQPDNYTLTPEFQVSLVNAGLDALEAGLSSLPEGFVKELSSISNAPLEISLVRSILDVSGQVPPDQTGLQYWSGKNACIALCVTDTTLQDFYHQLFHVLETYLFSESSELDLWDKLNPKGFSYDYNYLDYPAHADSDYLGKKRAFIDAFSMSYAKEDRARIFEYAMLEGCEEFFSAETMQEKLHQLSYCIRDAFGWRKSTSTYPWEQYLEESLAYKKRK